MNFYLFSTSIGRGKTEKGQYKKEIISDYVLGCCMLVRKDVIQKIGLMDEEYFIYGEEMDWQYAMKKKGYKIISTPFSKVWHEGGDLQKRNLI